jgi:hypothetical protein
MLCITLLAVSCARDYSKDLVGKWNAGKASQNSEIIVEIRADKTLTAMITHADIKPVIAAYTVEKDRLSIKFPQFDMSYRIVKLDKDVMVMKSKFGRITWNRLK